MDDLLPIFRYEQSQYHEHLDKRQFLNIYKSEGYIRAINEIESNDRFIWMYNFAIIFFRMDPVLSTVTAEHEKEELIIKLRTLYSYDIEALNEIEDFNKDYNTENPIKSYDKMKSIREILNKALRQKDFELIAPFNIISDFDEIVQFWISNENLKTNQISLGLMMIQTGKLNEAKKYYESLIKYLPDNHPLEKYCKYSLGNLAQKKGEIDDAEKYYNEAFENQVDTLLRARVTCALANIYFSKNDKSKAFEYYKLALSMFNKNHKDFILDIIECYTGIGKYYQTSQIDKDYEKALKSFTNAINELDNWISKNILGVIFEINTIKASYNILHPFADISKLSVIQDEEEILFFAGTVFRINSVEKENDSTWIIKLTLCNQTVEQMEQLMDAIKEQLTSITCWDHLYMKIDDWMRFGKYYKILTGRTFSWKDIMTTLVGIDFYYLMSILGDYETAIEYYKELLWDEKFIDDQKCLVLNMMIGYNYFHLFEYDNALFHYDIALSSLDDNNKLIREVYILIGDVWRAKDNVETALSYYKKSIRNYYE
ncbi:unnamed protein product [Rotaria sp. Silwood1]|nr:unnamed protein product [Rotaria sp. Silwood1]